MVLRWKDKLNLVEALLFEGGSAVFVLFCHFISFVLKIFSTKNDEI